MKSQSKTSEEISFTFNKFIWSLCILFVIEKKIQVPLFVIDAQIIHPQNYSPLPGAPGGCGGSLETPCRSPTLCLVTNVFISVLLPVIEYPGLSSCFLLAVVSWGRWSHMFRWRRLRSRWCSDHFSHWHSYSWHRGRCRVLE